MPTENKSLPGDLWELHIGLRRNTLVAEASKCIHHKAFAFLILWSFTAHPMSLWMMRGHVCGWHIHVCECICIRVHVHVKVSGQPQI